MTKADLKPGYLVVLRNRHERLVMPVKSENNLVLTALNVRSTRMANSLIKYNDDMAHEDDVCLDIMAVYGYVDNVVYTFDTDAKRSRPLLWERKEPRKITRSALRKALGFDFEIVEEGGEND